MFKLKYAAWCVVFLTGFALFAAPVAATGQTEARDSTASSAFAAVPPFAPGTETWDAPDGEHCEVPVLNWVRLGQEFSPGQCSPQKSERARVTLRANLNKHQPMSLLLEWQIFKKGKIVFRCTGPTTLFYTDANQVDQHYSFTAKPGTDIQTANLYVTAYGWSSLEWSTTGRCVKTP